MVFMQVNYKFLVCRTSAVDKEINVLKIILTHHLEKFMLLNFESIILLLDYISAFLQLRNRVMY